MIRWGDLIADDVFRLYARMLESMQSPRSSQGFDQDGRMPASRMPEWFPTIAAMMRGIHPRFCSAVVLHVGGVIETRWASASIRFDDWEHRPEGERQITIYEQQAVPLTYRQIASVLMLTEAVVREIFLEGRPVVTERLADFRARSSEDTRGLRGMRLEWSAL